MILLSQHLQIEGKTRMRDRLIFEATALPEVTWVFMDIVHQDAEQWPRCGAASKTAREPMSSDMRRRELDTAHLNPRCAFGISDTIAGGPAGANQIGAGIEDEEALFAPIAEPLEQTQRFGALWGRANVKRSCEFNLNQSNPESDVGGTFAS